LNQKTTLSALVARKLREKYTSKKDGVAIILVQADVQWNEASFVEDLLDSVFRQLAGDYEDAEVHNMLYSDYQNYLETRRLRQRSATRIRMLRKALHQLLSTLENAFLVFDGFDRCSHGVDLFLEEELPRLREKGLRIMTTSRVPCLTEPLEDANCDGNHGECPEPGPHTIYWECQNCKSKEDCFILCPTCHSRGDICSNW
jgi:hypothetical protein